MEDRAGSRAVEGFGDFPGGAHRADPALGFAEREVESDTESGDITDGVRRVRGNAVFADQNGQFRFVMNGFSVEN